MDLALTTLRAGTCADVRFPQANTALQSSLDLQGVCVPLLVTPGAQGTFCILDGHRRWRHAREQNVESLPCQVLALTDVAQRLRLFWQVHQTGSALNRVELARFVALTKSELGGAAASCLKQWSVVRSDHELEELLFLASLNERQLEFALHSSEGVRKVLQLRPLRADDRAAWSMWIEQLPWGVNVVQEMTEALCDISARDGKTFAQILLALQAAELVQGVSEEGGTQRGHEAAQELRQRILGLRHPRRQGRLQAQSQWISRLRWPRFVRARADGSFERPGLEVQLQLERVEQVEQALQALKQLQTDWPADTAGGGTPHD